MKKLAVITSHPIQYNAPLFALLHRRGIVSLKVFYTWGHEVLNDKFDPGFGKVVKWDIPLLEGYEYSFADNVATDKGTHHFRGIDTPGLVAEVENYGASAVLVYGWAFKSHLKLMRYFKGKIPVLFRGDSTNIDKLGFISALKRKIFLRWVYSFADMALYTGASNREYFLTSGFSSNRLKFSPHAVENKRFECVDDNCREQSRQLRHQLGIEENSILFLFAGKLEPKKDPALLLEAFLNISAGTDAFLLVVGNGILENSLKAKFWDVRNIRFMDFQNQSVMPAIYNMSDVFVLPSAGPGETWGLAVNEAMANGKAVIVSDKCGCAADLVKHGYNGYLFESGNLAQLGSCLKQFLSDRSLLRKMGTNSRLVIDDYSFDKAAEAVETAVLEVCRS